MKLGILVAGVCVAVAGVAMAAEEFASAKEAEALVNKVVAALKANRAQTFKEITDKDAKWIDRDLYPTVMDLSGKVLAHGQNPKMVDKDLIDFKDPDGKLFYKERMELAKSKGKFWQDYKFTDPISKKVLPKQAYCYALTDAVVCAGVYKR
ncbi:cache domain-containing protein [Uliginosibacterium sediminicola]|uniref:Cache domain-containing protein n=1 Tax=Uliginosibacterium sediminicola TaxID=2024550 RepID=A0ABU9Z3Q2_9RHOO